MPIQTSLARKSSVKEPLLYALYIQMVKWLLPVQQKIAAFLSSAWLLHSQEPSFKEFSFVTGVVLVSVPC